MKLILSVLFLVMTVTGFAQKRNKVIDNVTGRPTMIEEGDSTFSFPTAKGYTFIKSGDSVTIRITKSWMLVAKYKVQFSGATRMQDKTILYTYDAFFTSGVGMWANPGHRQFYIKDISGNKILTEDR